MIVGQISLMSVFVYTNYLICIYKKENYTVVYVRILLDFKPSYVLLLDSIDCFLFEFFHREYSF